MNLSEIKERPVAEIVSHCMTLRAQAKAKEDEANTLKQQANDMLKVLMPEHKLSSVKDDSGNTLSYKVTQRASLDQAKLKQVLANANVPVDIIVDAFELATTKQEIVTIEYRTAKGNVG